VKELDSYLNDHLAGSVSALELLEHAIKVHRDKPLGTFFSDIEGGIRCDQKTLRDLMTSLGIKESNLRKAGAWAAEKVGRTRLMIAGNEPGDHGLVLIFEALIMGVLGKKLMWRALASANLPQLSGYDFKELQRRAEKQIERLETERIRVVPETFAETTALH
jgi:hypothetical protein